MASLKVDMRDERLWRGDQPIRLSNKAFQLLRLFVTNPNHLLTKDHIIEGLWGDICVSEGLIKEYVHDLRQALGDDPKSPRYIETVHGRGYRFLGAIEETRCADIPAARQEAGSRPASVVVPAFANLTGERRWDRFCRGLSDDLVTGLARYPDLTVIANKALSGPAVEGVDVLEPGRTLAASYVLHGSVQVSNATIRVNVKLVETVSGRHVWTAQYDRKLGDLFAIQSDIVSHVASAVGGFSGEIPRQERLRVERKPPEDLRAYELYLLGYELEFRFKKQSALRAIGLLRRATELDPGFARAWLVLGWTCWQIALEGWTDDAPAYRKLMREAFKNAATLDPLDPFAVMEYAVVQAIDGDIIRARDGVERALDLGRNQADLLIKISNYLATVLDEPTRAIHTLEKGLRLPPKLSDWHHMSVTRVAYFAEDYCRSIEHAKLAADNLPTRLLEMLSLAQLGRTKEVRELRRAFVARYPAFDREAYMLDHPITAANAKRLFLDGAEKAKLRSRSFEPVNAA